ncbi:MAG: ABC transporter permease [Tannerella sp.]|jgi:ABC-2 type transport system permease protein|nr:ABC transporter permease [Tannerella sp.]
MEGKKMTEIIAEGIHDMFYIWKKEFKNVFRDSGVMIFFFVVPLIYPLIYSFIYDQETTHEVKVVAVDNSNSAYSREFIRRVNATPDVRITAVCASMDEAKTILNRKEAYGILMFPSEFSKNLHSGKQVTVSLYCDMSLLLYYKAMLLSATEVSLEMNKEISAHNRLQSTDTFGELQINPVPYEAIALFNPSNGFASFLLPGVLMLVIQQTLILGIGMLAGTARERNRFHHLVPENVRFHGILRVVAGKSLAYMVVYVAVCIWTLFVVPKLFSFPSAGRSTTLLLFLLPYLFSCIFFAMTLSGFMRTRETPMMIFVFLSVVLLFISGISWPEEAFPAYWRVLSNVFPSTPGINGYVLIKSCGATLNEVAREYHLLWLQTGIYFVTACLVYRRQIIRVKKKQVE